MIKIVSAKTAGTVILILLAGLLILHIFILAGILSFDLVWGGNIEFKSDMIKLELVALITTLLFLMTTTYKLKYLRKEMNSNIINIGIWIMFIYFTLNIVGNLVAKTGGERMIFTPVSILLSLFSLRLALEK
jgi:hypothetical protein